VRHVRAALARTAGLIARRDADEELLEELRSHIEMETAENIRRGMPPSEARRQAMLASGGVTQAVEAMRGQRGWPWVDGIIADIRYALRSLRRTPAFFAIVVITLALGIGANTAIFSVVRGVLLKPLPHREGDRLVYLRHSVEGPAGASIAFSIPEVLQFRESASSLAGIAEFSSWSLGLQENGQTSRINVGLVTGNYFEILGLSPVLGRLTGPGDDGVGVPPVMVLTHDFWVRRFGGDSSLVGSQVKLDGRSVTVIGVVQPAPFYPGRVDALLNMAISEHHLSAQMVQGRTHRMTEVVARLAPGASIEQARTEIADISRRMMGEFMEAYDPAANHRMTVVPFQAVFGERARLTLLLLMGAAAFILIVSAANVANLTLMRGMHREHELVVRASLGAGAGRLRRLLLVENLVLTSIGAVVGLLLGIGGLRLLIAIAARYSPRADEIRLDSTVLAFTLALAISLALVLSFAASLPAEGTFASTISGGGRRTSASPRKQRLQRILVVTQVAVSVVLLAGAGLLTRTMMELASVETGLATEEVLAMQVTLLTPGQLLAGLDPEAKERYAEIQREVSALPGVLDVGLGSSMPLRSSAVQFDLEAEGKALDVGEAIPRAELRTADPVYFRAAGISLLKGKPFEPTDRKGSELVAIVNETLADRFFPGEDPIGKRVAWTGDILRFTPFSSEWRRIVGVVGNTQDGGLDAPPRMVVFLPFAQELAISGALVVRVDGDAAGKATVVQRVVRRVAATALIENVMTIAQIKDQSVSPRRLNAALVSSFGIVAVIIAAVGIAGVLAFSVSAQTREIGIRMSLGADSGSVQRMILKEGATLLAVGLLLGVGGAFLGARVIRQLLFGVAPHDPVTLIAVTAIMAAIGIGACWIPARRAARIDPAITLRS
jgi:putative ABC transport system permease protein